MHFTRGYRLIPMIGLLIYVNHIMRYCLRITHFAVPRKKTTNFIN